jgi:hypothetical protein
MKRVIGITLLALSTIGLVVGITLATRSDAGYRAVGMVLYEHVHSGVEAADRGSSVREAFVQPQSPLPLGIALMGALSADTADRIWGATVAGAIAMALAVFFVGLAAWQLGGPVAGIAGMLLMLTLPGTLFHARTLGPEAGIACAFALLLWVSVHSQTRLWVATLATVAFLAALGSSHEAILLFIPWVAAAIYTAPKDDASEGTPGRIHLGAIPLGTFLPLVAGPLLLFWLWPHLSVAGGSRWIHLLTEPYRTSHPPFLVLGEVRDQVMDGQGPNGLHGLLLFLLRMPLTTAALALFGAIRVARSLRDKGSLSRAAFALFGALTLMTVIVLNGSPYYAGQDGFMALAPFVVLLAALGTGVLARAIQARWLQPIPIPTGIAVMAVVLVLVGPAAVELAVVYPMEPTYHNTLVGGVPGAVERGLETRTDTYLPTSTLNWLNQRLASGHARIGFAVASEEYRPFMMRLNRFGVLDPGIGTAEPYDATHVFVPRRPGEPLFDDVMASWSEPVYVFEHLGVRHLALYSR